jgi:putative transposase
LLVSYRPALAVSTIAKQLKGTTARRMRADYSGNCNRAQMHGHCRTPSYFAVAAGGAPWSIIQQYIENQAGPP